MKGMSAKFQFGLFSILLLLLLLLLQTGIYYSSVRDVAGGPLTDPKAGLLEANENSAVGESYLHIVESNLTYDLGNYVGMIKVGGDVPIKTGNSSTIIEWGFMIDADRNVGTSLGGLVNDIGIDYVVRLCLQGDRQWAEVYNATNDRSRGIDYEVKGNQITLTFHLPSGSVFSDQYGPNFDFVVLVREHVNNTFVIFDKAPNEGHYNYHSEIIADPTGDGDETILVTVITWVNTSMSPTTQGTSTTASITSAKTTGGVLTTTQSGGQSKTMPLSLDLVTLGGIAALIIVVAGIALSYRSVRTRKPEKSPS